MAHPAVQPAAAAPRLTGRPWALAAGAVVAAVIAASLPGALVGVFYDDGIYAVLARSLAEGRGYRLLHLPGAPAAVHYPFGYPLFLAALWKLGPAFPANTGLLLGANAVLMGVFAALATAYLGPRLPLPRGVTALTVTAACLAVPMIAVATVLFSEPLFLVLAAGALWSADAAREGAGPRGWRLAALAGVLAGLAALTRSIGVSVILGVVVAIGLRARGRGALAAGLAAAVLMPWLVFARANAGATDPAMVSNYGTYGQFLAQAGTDWFSPGSLVDLLVPLGAVALPPLGTTARIVLGLAALAVMLRGGAVLLRRTPALAVMLVGYLAIVALWPYGPSRFLWGIMPWLAAALAAGVAVLWTADGAASGALRSRRALAAAAGAACAAGYLWTQSGGWLRGAATAAQRDISATLGEVLPWIREGTDSTAIIAGEDEALLYLYTGRRAVPSFLWRVRGRDAESFGPDTLKAFLERTGATHLILSGPGSDAAPTVDALLGRHPGLLRVVRAWPNPILAFEVRRGG